MKEARNVHDERWKKERRQNKGPLLRSCACDAQQKTTKNSPKKTKIIIKTPTNPPPPKKQETNEDQDTPAGR